MAEFTVMVPAHVTYYKYVIEADTLEQAQAKYAEEGSEAGEYLGYIDGDWDTDTEPEWSEDDQYVEGHG